MFLKNLFATRARQRKAAGALYLSAVEKARDPAFYLRLGVPDTVDGRFDLIVVHVMLVLRALRQAAGPGAAVGQKVFDIMFRDMDRGLREMGVGDMGVGKHIKRMAKAFYGRAEIYEAGLAAARAGDPSALESALSETLFRRVSPSSSAPDMARYLLRAAAHVEQQSGAVIAAGTIDLAVPVAS